MCVFCMLFFSNFVSLPVSISVQSLDRQHDTDLDANNNTYYDGQQWANNISLTGYRLK